MRRALIAIFTALPLFCADIVNYQIIQNSTDALDLRLNLNEAWHGNITQKNDKDSVTFIFSNLTTKTSSHKLANSSIIEQISLKQSAQGAQLMLQSARLFDAQSEVLEGAIMIRLTSPSIPMTIEKIANDANEGGGAALALDIALYIVIFLAALAIAFFVFAKFKILKKQPQNAVDKKIEPLLKSSITLDESAKKEPKSDAIEPQKPKAEEKQPQKAQKSAKKAAPKPKKASKKQPVKNAQNSKGLFDL